MMRSFSFVFILFVFAVPAPAADTFFSIDTYPHPKADYYPWITYLTRGPSERMETGGDGQVRLISYRVAVLGDEVETLVFLEEIISGEGDCCRSVLSIRRLDLEAIYARFSLSAPASDFVFLRWRSPTRFEFEIRNRRFLLDGLGNEKLWVKEETDVGSPMSALPPTGAAVSLIKSETLTRFGWTDGVIFKPAAKPPPINARKRIYRSK